MEDANYCHILEAEEFCPLCAVTQEICEGFAGLLTPENGNPRVHTIATEHGAAICKAWNRIASQLNHPGFGYVLLTWNENFIVISEAPSD